MRRRGGFCVRGMLWTEWIVVDELTSQDEQLLSSSLDVWAGLHSKS